MRRNIYEAELANDLLQPEANDNHVELTDEDYHEDGGFEDSADDPEQMEAENNQVELEHLEKG